MTALARLSSDVVCCPRCRHPIQVHGTTKARDRAWCSAYRRDGTQCDCTRVPTEDELDRVMREPRFEEPADGDPGRLLPARGERATGKDGGLMNKHTTFRNECEAEGMDVEAYRGRFYYEGPAVRTEEDGWPTLQDVIRATSVKVQWDQMGRDDYIVYPR